MRTHRPEGGLALRLPSFVAALAALFLCAMPVVADEGMWMPQQILDLAPRLQELGFAADPKIWADLTGFPMGAIVSLGGCSASFVSGRAHRHQPSLCPGLLQYNATPEHNLIVDGFLAATRADELWNGPGSRVFVTVKVTEVHPGDHRQARPEGDRSPAFRHRREADQRAHGGV